MTTIFDTINEKEEQGEISEERAIELQNKAMLGYM